MTAPDKVARPLAWAMLVLTVAMAGGLLVAAARLPKFTDAAAPTPAAPPWPDAVAIPSSAWTAIQRSQGVPAQAERGPLAARFRLAGTFFLFGGEDGAASEANRRAVLDDLQKNEQHLVREGDRVDDYEVVRVFEDRLYLRAAGVEYELALSFVSTTAVSAAASAAPAASSDSLEDQPALETSRFGKRVGSNRWVFQRDELLKYYREVLDEPERIAALYMSLKPDYQENAVAGYVLEEEGERDFFQAVGLRQGDVVRRVNSMRMTSQRRAEYFMSEFLKDRVSALVLDIERGGKPEKLIYLIR